MTDAARVLDEAIAGASDPRLRARAQVERELVRLEAETSVGTGPGIASRTPCCPSSSATATTTVSAAALAAARSARLERGPRGGTPTRLGARPPRAPVARATSAGCSRSWAGAPRPPCSGPTPGRRGDPPLRGVPRARSREPDRDGVDAQPAGLAARDEGRVRARRKAARTGRRDPARARRPWRRACPTTRRSSGCSPGSPRSPRRRCEADDGDPLGDERRQRARDDHRDARAGRLRAGAPARGRRAVPRDRRAGARRRTPRRRRSGAACWRRSLLARAAARRPRLSPARRSRSSSRPTCSLTAVMRCSTSPTCCGRANTRRRRLARRGRASGCTSSRATRPRPLRRGHCSRIDSGGR